MDTLRESNTIWSNADAHYRSWRRYHKCRIHTKMNTIGGGVNNKAIDIAEQEEKYKGVEYIGENFSAGANVGMIL